MILRRPLLPALLVVLSLGAVVAWPDGEQTGVPAPTPRPTPTGQVVIHRPAGPPTVDTGKRDRHGAPVRVACSTCHSARTPVTETAATADLDLFHQGLTIGHGGQSCLSCHNADDYDTLRRADGSAVLYRDVMELCGQCHGPQRRDYDHGAHGGMTGHWDLSQGDRTRNGCTDCHDPHAPAYPQMRPVFPPAKDQRHAR